MKWIICVFLVLSQLLGLSRLTAQVFPAENRIVNYRMVGFSFPLDRNDHNYRLEIAAGRLNSDDAFSKAIIISEKLDTNRKIVEVPEFGRDYTWRYSRVVGSGKVEKSNLFHFSTGTCISVDTSCSRLRIVKNSGQFSGSYLFLDQSKVMCDMNGRPVWYLPCIDSIVNEKSLPRDMKLTSRGTITFVVFGRGYEITYDGKVLWTSKPEDPAANVREFRMHHEFTRLHNGHYMGMSIEPTQLQVRTTHVARLPRGADPRAARSVDSLPSASIKFQGGKLIEYDQDGNIVWTWRSSQYFSAQGADFAYNHLPDGSVNTDVHDNGFYFDEPEHCIYISYKNINRILKINYPGGEVLAEYGTKYQPGMTDDDNGMFCGQHCIKKSEHGYLYLFNNNACNHSDFPRVALLQEPGPGEHGLKLIWEYVCNNDGIGPDENNNIRSLAGGSVEELKDSSLLVCMGTPCSKVFIVNRRKEETWSAYAEIWKNDISKWQLMALYRVSMIKNTGDLNKLIWSSQH